MAVIDQELTQDYAIYNGDCCEVLPTLPNGSVHLSVYSPPFCGLYNYSSSERDLSNCRSYEEFFLHYEFVVRELFDADYCYKVSEEVKSFLLELNVMESELSLKAA